MPFVSVRELKTQSTEIVRDVRSNRAKYIITDHGQPVAIILPIDEQQVPREA